MPKIKYIDKTFQKKSLWLIGVANEIIDDYRNRGYDLTLRQLYYQLVAKDLIANSEKSYKKLGNTITQARDAGLVDWRAIIDRTRSRRGLTTWSSPSEIVRAAANGYRIDKWQQQIYRLFVWVEKEALAGVVSRACNDDGVQVDYLSCRGYMSASTIWREAQNITGAISGGQTPVFLHLGDHDPSGIDMTRDNIDRLALYSDQQEGEGFIFRRIALNWAQVEQYSPPPNFAKLTDSRANGYIDRYGRESWELDALDPDVLVDLIQNTIDEYRDADTWEKWAKVENEDRAKLDAAIKGLEI
jgi:hypothetical protein